MFLTSKKPLNEWLLKWCRVSESNQGHRDFQSLALPTELTRHVLFNFSLLLVEQVVNRISTGSASLALTELTRHVLFNFSLLLVEQVVNRISTGSASLALTELTRHVLFNFKKTKSANYCKNPFSVCPKYQKHILKSSKFQKFIDRLEILHTKTNKSAFRGSIFLKAF